MLVVLHSLLGVEGAIVEVRVFMGREVVDVVAVRLELRGLVLASHRAGFFSN